MKQICLKQMIYNLYLTVDNNFFYSQLYNKHDFKSKNITLTLVLDTYLYIYRLIY